MKLLLLLLVGLIDALDTMHEMQNAVTILNSSFAHKKIDTTTPFTIEYRDKYDNLCSTTAIFSYHLRNYINMSQTIASIYKDSRSGLKLFNVYMLKDQGLIPLGKSVEYDGNSNVSTFSLLSDYLPAIEKNELSIWNNCQTLKPFKEDEHLKPYNVTIWYAVLGSVNIVEMQHKLYTEQIKKCIEKYQSTLD
jgi:hypothetical protein